MITAFALFVAVAVDPRPALVELQLQNRHRDALVLTQRELEDHPGEARAMGLDYLRGHLFDVLGDAALAGDAFGAALANTPDLGLYSRYRMALEQAEMGHPEVAAGLVATVVGKAPPSPLASDAVRLFIRTLGQGGDCRLFRGLTPEKLPAASRRALLLAQADCALQNSHRELARNLLVKILEENRQDDPGRAAAERLAGLISDAERGRVPMLLGMTFHLHREIERALANLQRALGGGGALSEKDAQEARYVQARAQLLEQRYGPAAALFGRLAQRSRNLRERARSLYQQGCSYEMLGDWPLAEASFQTAYLAEPGGEWGAPSLLAALRLQWRSNNEAAAATIFYTLLGRPEWREAALRAGLFLAASDIVRGRGDRAHAWLDRLLPATGDDRLELAYWRGRLAELDKDPGGAVDAYLEALRSDAYHPLSRIALSRLAAEPLARAAREAGRRLAASSRPQDLYGAWLLLGNLSPPDETAKVARRRLLQMLTADRATAPFVRLAEVPIAAWPLWKKPLLHPEDKLLALGLWHEGAPVVRDQFPVTEPSLGLTGSLFLARGGEHARSIQQAEVLRQRTPGRVPLAIQPRVLHVVLYPYPYRGILLNQGKQRGVDPDLLAAIIREESRFDPNALSPEAARGLTQLTLADARRLAALIDLRFEPDDLYRPEVSAALGATALAMILRDLDNLDYMAVAAYEAGVPQARLWRSYCFSQGRFDEYFTKMSFADSRVWLRRVLTSRAHYEELY
jgi:soluble lytic murein transglycosylase